MNDNCCQKIIFNRLKLTELEEIWIGLFLFPITVAGIQKLFHLLENFDFIEIIMVLLLFVFENSSLS